MEELETPTAVFEQMDDGDELVIETVYDMVYNREVIDDTSPPIQGDEVDPSERKFVFGDFEQCDYLVIGHRGPEIKGIESDGSLEVSGETVSTIVNVSQDVWAGENDELID